MFISLEETGRCHLLLMRYSERNSSLQEREGSSKWQWKHSLRIGAEVFHHTCFAAHSRSVCTSDIKRDASVSAAVVSSPAPAESGCTAVIAASAKVVDCCSSASWVAFTLALWPGFVPATRFTFRIASAEKVRNGCQHGCLVVLLRMVSRASCTLHAVMCHGGSKN